MKTLRLATAFALHRKRRTVLTMLSVTVAFFLYAVLQTVSGAVALGARVNAMDRIMVTSRAGLGQPLPHVHRQVIEKVAGVAHVNPVVWVSASYQDPKNAIQAMAVDPVEVFAVDPSIVVSPEEKAAFVNGRTGVLVGAHLAEKYGWRIGTRVPLMSPWVQKNGSNSWEVEVVGLYTLDAELLGQPVAANSLLINYQYFDAARKWPGEVNWFSVRVSNPQQLADVARVIDNQFVTTAAPTRSQGEYEMASAFLRQFGDVAMIISGILAAVFFSVIMVTSNTMLQAFKARVPHLAVLKTLGFPEESLARLCIAEAALVTGIGATSGLLLAAWVITKVKPLVMQVLPGFSYSLTTVASAGLLALSLIAVSVALPIWRTRRLEVVDALLRT